MVDINNPELHEAYEKIMSDNSEETWVVCGMEGNNLIVNGMGTGDQDEWAPLLKDDQCQYIYFRVMASDEENVRTKFVFVSWCGESVSPIKRARMSVQKADVKNIFKNFAIELHATHLDDINMEEITTRVKKASGADYSGNKSFE